MMLDVLDVHLLDVLNNPAKFHLSYFHNLLDVLNNPAKFHLHQIRA